MARIIYSALVDSIRGSIQGTTFQRNAYGYTIKGKPNMVNPNTANQNAHKARFSAAIQAWRNITDANRAAWDAYANAFPIPSRKNPDAYLSGFNAFCRWHALTFTTSFTVLADPAGDQGTVTAFTPVLAINMGALRMLFDVIVTEGPWKAYVQLSRPLKGTQTFVKGWTRQVGDPGEGTWDDFDISFGYTRQFGALPVVGDLIGVRIAYQNTTNGQIYFAPPEVVEVT